MNMLHVIHDLISVCNTSRLGPQLGQERCKGHVWWRVHTTLACVPVNFEVWRARSQATWPTKPSALARRRHFEERFIKARCILNISNHWTSSMYTASSSVDARSRSPEEAELVQLQWLLDTWERDHFEDLSVEGRIILTWMLKKYDSRAWTALV